MPGLALSRPVGYTSRQVGPSSTLRSPNSAGEGETFGEAFIAPLAGTEPLAVTLGANAVTAAGSYALPAITRYTEGTHGTPVSADNASVFSEMVGQTVGMILSGGTGTTATDETVIQQ